MKPNRIAVLCTVLCAMAQGAIAMGPDPGGHTGATVTPETTKTDRPNVDAARQSASGSSTENSGPATNAPQTAKKK